MKKMQKARAEALGAALDVMAKAGRASGAERIELDPKNVLTYAKFILGERSPASPAELREVRTRLDSTEADEEFPRPPVGEDPGDRGVLTQWAEAIRQQDAAREAAREARDLEVDPEEKEEQKRRRKRDDALRRGRGKLRDRLTTMEQRNTDRVEPLDEDELLAVAGSEVYPPNDDEPSRELTIRNRMGEVRGYSKSGWTRDPADPWPLRLPWTSPEMSRRGPWHIV